VINTRPVRIGVPDLISNSYFPAVAVVELGFLRAERVDANVELIFPVTRTMAMLRDGELDFVAGAAHATTSAFPGWQGAKLLAALARHMYWMLILRADLKAAPGDISATRGLRIGAAPGPDAGLRRMLTVAGIDPDNDAHVGPIPGATAPGVSFGVTAAKALEAGEIDGFWANAMGAEIAIRSGIGTAVLDIRRGLGPARAELYTFPALVTTDSMIERDPELVRAVVRAIVHTQAALRENPDLATRVGERLFQAEEASLIAGLIRRDLPFYDASITPEMVGGLSELSGSNEGNAAPYDAVVATQFSSLWQ
jgi:ABC-type nitrate/sulfonate/bicarbonate transport system substrate-binding protein